MIQVFALGTAIASFSSFLLGLFIYLKNRTEFQNKTFLLLSLAIVFWILPYSIWLRQTDPESALFWSRLLNLGAVLIPVFFLHWVISFLKLNGAKKRILFFAYLITAFFAAFSFSPWFIKDVEPVYIFPYWPQAGWLYSIFLVISFFSFFSYAFFLLFNARNKGTREHQLQIRYIFIGASLSVIGGSSNFPLMYGIPFWPFFTLLTIFYPMFWVYAILKFHLHNIKVIGTELLIFALWIFVLIRTLLAESIMEGIINGALFIVLVVLGFFLIRSVLQEVKSREKIQELAEELELANKQLKRLDRVKSEFISIASHQLRTPLSIIKGYSSMALEGDFGSFKRKEQKEVFEKISLSANRLINLIEDLLNISRLEQGRLSYEYSQVDMIKLVKGVVKELEPKAKAKHIKMFFKMPDEPVPKMLVDKDKLRQVFINLIDNSIKYTEKGKIEVNVEKIDSKVRIEVADTGAGLTREELSVLFQRFMRGKRVTQLYTEGVGLGLYFAKNIVEGHGGRIWAESPGPGKGSKFYVELPIKKQKAEARK
jgi:signal transduction histidine kinase